MQTTLLSASIAAFLAFTDPINNRSCSTIVFIEKKKSMYKLTCASQTPVVQGSTGHPIGSVSLKNPNTPVLWGASLFSCVLLFVTPWTVACRIPLSTDPPGKNTRVGCLCPPQLINLRPIKQSSSLISQT